MKSKIILLLTLICFILTEAKAQDNSDFITYPWIEVSKSVKDRDTVIYALKSKVLYKGVPNQMLIITRPKREIKIVFNQGTVKQLKDSIYEIIPTTLGDHEIQINALRANLNIEALPNPKGFYLKGFPYAQPIDDPYVFVRDITLDNLYRYNKIEGRFMDYVYKIKEFQFQIRDKGRLIAESPVFHSDSISHDFLNSINIDRHIGLSLQIRTIVYDNPDPTEKTGKSSYGGYTLTEIYKDSSDMLIGRYFFNYPVHNSIYQLVKSDVRISIEGNPKKEDIQTIQNIADELNVLLTSIRVKIVKHLPSMIIQFDTINRKNDKTANAKFKTEKRFGENQFFPLLSSCNVFINTKFTNQQERDLILWEEISKALGSFRSYPNMTSTLIGKNKIPGLTYEDKLVLKSIYSPGSKRIVKQVLNRIPGNIPNTHILLAILVTVILFFIFYEVNNYFNFTGKMGIASIRQVVSTLFVAQIAIVSYYIFKPDDLILNPYYMGFATKFNFKQLEIYACGFAIIAGLFFNGEDLLAKIYKVKWLKLALNPILSIISLYLVYQIVYLFVRGEFLRFITIDINAITIGFSIIAVRFYLQYEQVKITSLMQEKEYELTKQKEMKSRAELNALQARINPHFLYNALNSIAALVHIDSKRTENMVLSLSRLFRYTINREEEMNSTIGQEIEMTEIYLEIEKHRFTDRLDYSIVVDEKLKEEVVPRLLIQPLVENSIKHGISKITGQGIIKLKIFEQDKELFIEIYDNGPGFPEGLLSGYGLQNTYDKLSLIYKKPYDIKFVNSPEKYIQIKLKKS